MASERGANDPKTRTHSVVADERTAGRSDLHSQPGKVAISREDRPRVTGTEAHSGPTKFNGLTSEDWTVARWDPHGSSRDAGCDAAGLGISDVGGPNVGAGLTNSTSGSHCYVLAASGGTTRDVARQHDTRRQR